MKWLRRPARLPGPVLAMLQVPPEERVLAWGSTDRAGGTQTVVLAATDRALYVQEIGERIPWEQITKATWDEPTLDRYLKSPRDVVPGTKMTFPGIKDDAKRAAVIAYLQ